MYIAAAYAVYLCLSLAATVWVARTLERHGRIFLVDAFQGNAVLADSVNRLLVVGFYLINIGYAALALTTAAPIDSPRAAIELVCRKIGVVLLVLGSMHFINVYVFSRLRRRAGDRLAPRHSGAWTPAGAPLGRVLD